MAGLTPSLPAGNSAGPRRDRVIHRDSNPLWIINIGIMLSGSLRSSLAFHKPLHGREQLFCLDAWRYPLVVQWVFKILRLPAHEQDLRFRPPSPDMYRRSQQVAIGIGNFNYRDGHLYRFADGERAKLPIVARH